MVNRGGLLKPSDLLYMTCLNCWALFEKVMDNTEIKSMFLEFINSRQAFIKMTHTLLSEMPEYKAQDVHCHEQESHSFLNYLETFSRIFYNCMAKNFVKEINNVIHSERKRSASSKINVKDRKICKLTSSST